MEEMAGNTVCFINHSLPMRCSATRWLGYDDIIRLKGVEEMVEVHYNSGQFRNVLKELVKEFDTPFDLYRELAGYYDGNRITGISHSRLARY